MAAESSNTSSSCSSKVVVVGVDDSEESFYSLEWTVDNLLLTTLAAPAAMMRKQDHDDDDECPNPIPTPTPAALFKLIVVHVKVPALSVLRFSGPGVGDVLPLVEADLKKTASLITDKVKDLCNQKSISEYEVEVWEGDARNVLCEAVEKHRADILVVGSHGYGVFKRAILGSVSDYCAHHAHCSVLIVKKPKTTNKL